MNAETLRPRTRPRKPQGERVDNTPDGLFIKIYVKSARELLSQLTAAETKHLLALALRIDDQNSCFPSNNTAAHDVGRRSRNWSRELNQRLRKKGVINYQENADQSNEYTLCDAFGFGLDQNGEKQSVHMTLTPGGYYDSDPGGVVLHRPGGGTMTLTPNKNQYEPESKITKTSKNERGSAPNEGAAKKDAERALINAGVNERESALISAQYSADLINQVLATYQQRSSKVQNPGGWIRKSIEQRSGQRIAYPNSRSASAAQTPSSAPPPAPVSQRDTSASAAPTPDEQAAPGAAIELDGLIHVVSELTGLAPTLNAVALENAANALYTSGYTPLDVLTFGEWWYANDWRGKKDEPPSIQQMFESIERSLGFVKGDEFTPYERFWNT